MKKTKIVCTIGPSTWDPEVMRSVIEAGMNCARVNGAFADPAELDKVRDLVKSVSNDVSLMVDVKGPEVRMNKFAAPKEIKPGDTIIIGNTDKDEIYPSNYANLYTFLKPGQRLVVGDGDVELKLIKIENDRMICEVVYGELLKPGKALNLPGADIVSEVLTEKDKTNLIHSIKTGWDFVSASFIQTAEAAQYVQDFIKEHSPNSENPQTKLIAKIEDAQGLENIDEILKIVDGVMVARGGLGVELGLEQVPRAQRMLIKKCNEVGKPVIAATQILESMITNPRPTRAEVNDVYSAVEQGADAVMLSAESSAGRYPVAAVKMLVTASSVAEDDIKPFALKSKGLASASSDAITKAAAEMCIELSDQIDKVIIVTRTGTTARLLARHNIKQPIYAFTSSDYYVRTLMLTKNILKAITFEGISSDADNNKRDNAINKILEIAKSQGITKAGERVLLLGKKPIDVHDYFPNVFEVITVE